MATQTVNIGLEKVGPRVYITGNTYPVKDKLRDALGLTGKNFDGDRRQWWVGAAKQAAAEALVAQLNGAEPPKEDLSAKPLKGKVEYKGRTYYVLAESASGKFRLTVLDGSIDFWADKAECKWLKTYTPREYRRYGRLVQTSYTTLAGIREFVASQKAAEARGDAACAACGRRGDLVEDLEDGMLKCPGCCDMPSS